MSEHKLYAIVSATDAKRDPYPFVFVNEDGSVRELHQDERNFLETPYAVDDAAQAHIKEKFTSRDGWGSIAGFCRRSRLPRGCVVAPAPAENPNPPMSGDQFIEWLTQKTGSNAVRQPDGTIVLGQPGKDDRSRQG